MGRGGKRDNAGRKKAKLAPVESTRTLPRNPEEALWLLAEKALEQGDTRVAVTAVGLLAKIPLKADDANEDQKLRAANLARIWALAGGASGDTEPSSVDTDKQAPD